MNYYLSRFFLNTSITIFAKFNFKSYLSLYRTRIISSIQNSEKELDKLGPKFIYIF